MNVCRDCGKNFFSKNGKDRYCSDCRTKRGRLVTPSPVYKGMCTCWYDGLDYMIHECDCRRKLARERKRQGKPYIMPQCAFCTPDKPVNFKELQTCFFCGRGFESKNPGDKYCSKSCQRRDKQRQRKRLEKEKVA